MNNIELTEEQLEMIKAGNPHITEEEMLRLKNQIELMQSEKQMNMFDEELDLDTLSNVRGGQPLSYEEAREYFEQNIGRSR